jgi:hypothetical protein
MAVGFASAFGVSSNSANALEEERDRYIGLKRLLAQTPGGIIFDPRTVPISVRRPTNAIQYGTLGVTSAAFHIPCVDAGKSGIVLRFVSRSGCMRGKSIDAWQAMLRSQKKRCLIAFGASGALAQECLYEATPRYNCGVLSDTITVRS